MKSVLTPALILLLLSSYHSRSTQKGFDILIRNGTVYDGSGRPAFKADVGIKGNRIAFVGKVGRNTEPGLIIDAEGLIVSPGFIDPHTHAEQDLQTAGRSSNLAYLMQGVTTVFTGNDGSSPLNIASTLEKWDSIGIGTNAGLFAGHGSIRKSVMGFEDAAPNASQLERMCDFVRTAMQDGAFGLSTGLFYSPGSFAETEEVVELAKVANALGGIYDTHLRDESSYGVGLIESVKEALAIGRDSGIPIHISHIKALGKDVWGKSTEVIDLIQAARKDGVRVTANLYPYIASRTNLVAATIPRWVEEGGMEQMLVRLRDMALSVRINSEIKENIERRGGGEKLVISSAKDTTLNGKSIKEIAARWGVAEEEAVIKVLESDQSVRVVSFSMDEADLQNFMKQEWVMTGSDGTEGHPRKYASFTRKIEEYAIKRNILSLEEAIRTSTSLTAETLGIKERGLLKEGFFADVIVFNPNELRANATFTQSNLLAEGMRFVIVNGSLAIDNGKFTNMLAGKALRKNEQFAK